MIHRRRAASALLRNTASKYSGVDTEKLQRGSTFLSLSLSFKKTSSAAAKLQPFSDVTAALFPFFLFFLFFPRPGVERGNSSRTPPPPPSPDLSGSRHGGRVDGKPLPPAGDAAHDERRRAELG